jgi:CMP-N,N'-diacetyllegionaminic acid synthase
MKILGIVGARSGSKGLPGKNLRPLLGKPLLGWAIDIARRSRHVGRVVLSTDSEEYAAVGRECGADVPFLRPAELASDGAVEFGYIRHALEWLETHEDYAPEMVVRVCPTAPLIRPEDIDRAVEILQADPEADSAVLMTPAREHPRKQVKIAPDGVHVISYITERGSHVAPTNRQSYEAAYNRQSLPIVSRRRTILELGSQTGEVVRFHVVPQETTFDIDTGADFSIVEKLLREREQEGPSP